MLLPTSYCSCTDIGDGLLVFFLQPRYDLLFFSGIELHVTWSRRGGIGVSAESYRLDWCGGERGFDVLSQIKYRSTLCCSLLLQRILSVSPAPDLLQTLYK